MLKWEIHGKDTMLKLKYLYENYDLAKVCLSNWEHDEDNLDEMLGYFRISSNAIYPYCRDGRVCFLRLAPVEEKIEQNVYGEMDFIRWLEEKGYSAMKPMKAKSGEYVLTLSTEWGKYYVTSFERVKGVPIEDTEFDEKTMFSYGKALGRLHVLSRQYIPTTVKTSHEDALLWIEEELKQYDNPKIAQKELFAVRELLSILPKNETNYGLVHYDFEVDNVFYDNETNTCSVIDFDDGMYHWYALDVEQALDSITEECPEELVEQAKDAFLKGYSTERALIEEELRMLPLMRRFANLYAYTRIRHCLSETVDESEDWIKDLIRTLTNKTNMLEESFKQSLL